MESRLPDNWLELVRWGFPTPDSSRCAQLHGDPTANRLCDRRESL